MFFFSCFSFLVVLPNCDFYFILDLFSILDLNEDYSNGNCFGLVVAFSRSFSRMATQRNYYKNSLQANLSNDNGTLNNNGVHIYKQSL